MLVKKETKTYLMVLNKENSKNFKSKSDFLLFYSFRIKIGNENCSPSYNITNYFFTATGASNLRKHIKNDTDIYQIINFKDLKIFECPRTK